MDKKAFTNLFKNALTFLVIFLLVQAVFNWLNPPAPQSVQNTVNLVAGKNQYSLNDLVQVKLENHTGQPVTFKNLCPAPAVSVEKQVNGTWQPVTTNLNINCYGQSPTYTVPAGQTLLIPTTDWNHALFGEVGNYHFKLALDNGQTLQSDDFQVSGQTFFSWIWLTIFFQPIINALIFITSVMPFHDLGLAIILLTILIRTLLLIPNQRAMHYQRKMQLIQPKLAELKEKHGNDQQKIASETMSIYKEHKVNPLGSCLPILIQLPILFALYAVIQSGLSPNNNFLLYGSLKNFDLNLIQTNFFGIIELTKVNYTFLPIIVGLLQYFQIRLSLGRSKQKASGEMATMNKAMTIMMPVMITIFAASVPSGVGFYWASSTTYAIIQQLLFNRNQNHGETQIKVAGAARNKLKKQEYQQKTAARKAETGAADTAATEEKNDNDNQQPPVTIIKA